MIKINLLTVERQRAKKKLAFDPGQKLIASCSLLLVAAVLLIGWRYWSLDKESKRLDAEIASAESEAARLKAILAEVQQFEQRSAQLRERVSLIEQLRRDQTGPVHLLDQISRALPPMLWLTDVKQGTNPDEVLIEGRCIDPDRAVRLRRKPRAVRLFQTIDRDREHPDRNADRGQRGELVRFSIRAQFQQPSAAAPVEQAAPSPANPAVELKPRARPRPIPLSSRQDT